MSQILSRPKVRWRNSSPKPHVIAGVCGELCVFDVSNTVCVGTGNEKTTENMSQKL